MRRGGAGAILNSKGEFNRSHIPRLVLEEKEENTKEQEEEQKSKNKELDNWLEDWEQNRNRNRREERSSLATNLGKPTKKPGEKRELEQPEKVIKGKKRSLNMDSWTLSGVSKSHQRRLHGYKKLLS